MAVFGAGMGEVGFDGLMDKHRIQAADRDQKVFQQPGQPRQGDLALLVKL